MRHKGLSKMAVGFFGGGSCGNVDTQKAEPKPRTHGDQDAVLRLRPAGPMSRPQGPGKGAHFGGI